MNEESKDPIYDKALMVVKASNPPSVAKLQRTLMIGYNRAQRLMDAIVDSGIVERVEYEHGTGYRLVPNGPLKAPAENETEESEDGQRNY